MAKYLSELAFYLDEPGATRRWTLKNYGVGELPRQLADLVDVPQDPEHHPEGSAFTHTTYVMDAMCRLCRQEEIGFERRLVLMLAATCHDFGKATTTRFCEQRKRWIAHGHDVAGVPLAEAFIRENIEVSPEKQTKLISLVCPLVRHHMTHCRPASNHTPKAARKLLRSLAPASYDDLLLLMRADCAGRPPLPPDLPPSVDKLTSLVRCIESCED